MEATYAYATNNQQKAIFQHSTMRMRMLDLSPVEAEGGVTAGVLRAAQRVRVVRNGEVQHLGASPYNHTDGSDHYYHLSITRLIDLSVAKVECDCVVF